MSLGGSDGADHGWIAGSLLVHCSALLPKGRETCQRLVASGPVQSDRPSLSVDYMVRMLAKQDQAEPGVLEFEQQHSERAPRALPPWHSPPQ